MRLGTALRSFSLPLAGLLLSASLVSADTAPDQVSLSVVDAGHGKVRVTVTAGPSGAPFGFNVCWMKASDFAARGNTWPTNWVANEVWGNFNGVGTLNTWGSSNVDFHLSSSKSLDVELGDLQDETGVGGPGTIELEDGQEYVFMAYAIGSTPQLRGANSNTVNGTTSLQGQNCTYTQGYWKNHPSAWPVTSVTLGTVTYTQSQLLSIFGQPVQGNGLISLAHQLIAAKLNIAQGANSSIVASTIAAADAQIGSLVVPPIGSGSLSTSSTSAKTQTLDDFNNGVTGPGHCGEVPTQLKTWGEVKTTYR